MHTIRAPLSCLSLLFALVAACGGDGGAGAGGGGGAGLGGGSGTGLASVDPGSPNTPEGGCINGFTACGDVCVDLTNDSRHCNGCDAACADTPEGGRTTCVDGACVDCEGDACCGSATCDDTCGALGSADSCGSCHNQCAADLVCVDRACTSADGTGTSCEDPLIIDLDADKSPGFRWSDALTSEHVFVCGPLDPIPTRWFRVTIAGDELQLQVEGDPTDDYIVEAFSDASCDEAASLACHDGEVGDEDELDEVQIDPGSTVWIAVGLKNEWSGVAATILLKR